MRYLISSCGYLGTSVFEDRTPPGAADEQLTGRLAVIQDRAFHCTGREVGTYGGTAPLDALVIMLSRKLGSCEQFPSL